MMIQEESLNLSLQSCTKYLKQWKFFTGSAEVKQVINIKKKNEQFMEKKWYYY